MATIGVLTGERERWQRHRRAIANHLEQVHGEGPQAQTETHTYPGPPPHRQHRPGRFFTLLAVILIALAIVSAPLARAIVAPVEGLTRTAERLGSGDLSARTGITRRDELGALARSFDQMAERLERTIRAERELLANVSHELRTPLARIRVALELAAEEEDSQEHRREGSQGRGREEQTMTEQSSTSRYHREIAADLSELERLLEDVLTTARLDLAAGSPTSGLPALRQEDLDLYRVAEQALKRFAQRAPQREVEVHDERTSQRAQLRGDPMLLRRVVENLLDNADKYAPANAAITISLSSQATGATLSVKDRGPGIAPQDLPHVFEPFYRAERSRTRDAGGVGLGLALAKRIVESHGGSIGAKAREGGGLDVSFTLPLKGGLAQASKSK